MLALTRKPGESIKIGDDIIVKVVRVTGNEARVRLSIIAPRDVKIIRTEFEDKDGTRDAATE